MSHVHVLSIEGDLEVHKPGCRDLEKKRRSCAAPVTGEWLVEVPEGMDIERAVGLDIAGSGFASDEGMTPEEYFDKWGWPIRVLPCSKVKS